MSAEATERQRRATMPSLSAWVTANAGSGKTHVLVNRIARLLLEGCPPHRLLCLTFTKAAAAEMSVRLFEQLGRWTLLPDDALQMALFELSGVAPDDERVALARRLFADALESPGGLQIQTIHSFCQGLLKRFPLESGVAPAFTVLDEASTDELLADARDRVLREGLAGDKGLLAAVRALTEFAGEGQFDTLLRDVISERSVVQPFLETHGRHGLDAALRSSLGVGSFANEDVLLRHAMQDVPASVAGRVASALAQGSGRDQAKASVFAAYSATPGPERLLALLESLLTLKGEVTKTLATKAVFKIDPGVETQLETLAEIAVRVRQRRNALRIATNTGHLLLLAGEILRVYRTLKSFRAALDYDDLIARAAALFKSPGAQWVLYKLDGGIDHVLIDEAQDTSPSQWAVVRSIAAEFFAGVGAERSWQSPVRTVFAVGDIKQSIMSFQGARPIEFVTSQRLVHALAGGDTSIFDHVQLTHSFRSAPAILELVDEVFRDPEAADGVLLEHIAQDHKASRRDIQGLVELWPLEEPPTRSETIAWDAPRDRVGADHPAVVLAVRIARRIKSWIAEQIPVHDKETKALRAVTPGDVMILVRKRGQLSTEIIRQLKRLGIPVAGADRLVLAEHIAVMDLVALGRFALLPGDDLTLATVLRGPCCGVSEEDLFALAHGRGDKTSLWSVLQARAQDPLWQPVHAFLQRLHAMADHVQPYEFYATILGPLDGWTRLMQRLGLDAADPIEEFMSAALDFGRMHTPSLEGFLHAVERSDTEIKRDQDRSDGAVRVLTVHGSKGLEAPIVILPDTFTTPEHGRHDATLLQAGDTPLWKVETAWDEAVRRTAREAGREERMREYRRLLYVALTRPRDQLHVCGFRQERGGSQRNWHELVAAAMQRIGALAIENEDGQQVLRYGSIPSATELESAARVRAPLSLGAALPAWVFTPAPVERPDAEILPSERSVRRLGVGSPDAGRSPALDLGTAVHRALEVVADARSDLWAQKAREAALPHVAATELPGVVAEVLRVRQDASLQFLFGPGSFGEVALRGRVLWQGRKFRFPGRMDRVVVRDTDVLVVEFKTDRVVPTDMAGIRPAYIRQLALYRRALEGLYPGKPVSCGILWTATTRLTLLPLELVEACERVLDPVGAGS